MILSERRINHRIVQIHRAGSTSVTCIEYRRYNLVHFNKCVTWCECITTWYTTLQQNTHKGTTEHTQSYNLLCTSF